jgi:anti-sigma B factor antagonist
MLEVNAQRRDGATVLEPRGDVDLSTSKDLQVAIKQAMSDKPERVVVDLSSVSYMDSSGVATLVEAMQIARRQKTSLLLCGMQDKVRAIFEIARLDRVFVIVDSQQDALAR